MAHCKISIIMPVYNVERYVAFCLESIVHQTFQEIEVIIVNDGSTDGSLAILKEYEAKYPSMIHVYTTENRGVSHARNYGIERAAGEYILFVDSDDFLELNMCERLYEKASKDNNDIVLCRYYDIYENETTHQIRKKCGKAYEIAIGRNFNIHDTRFELTHISPFPWDKLFRRSLFDTHKFPEKLRFEDLAIMYCVITSAQSIGVIEDRLYNYRRSNQSSFLSNFSEGTLDIVRSLELFVEGMKKQNNYNEFIEEVEYICARHLLIRYNSIFDTATKGKLNIKKEMINRSMNFLEGNFPKWRENRYLKYTASKASKVKLAKYTSRGKMIRTATLREYTPVSFVKVLRKLKRITDKIKGKIKKFAKAKNKRHVIAQHIPGIKLLHLPNDVRYTLYYEKCKVNPKDIFLESKHGEDIAGNIFQMLLAFGDEKYQDYHIMLTLKESLMASYGNLLARYGIDYVDLIPTDSKEYFKVLATAKYLVTDTSFPTYYIKKPDQVYLNTWHGTPLKGMGRVVPQREYGLGNVQRNFFIADYLLYQNEFSRDIFVEDYMIAPLFNGKIMLSGYPRNSAFFNTNRYDEIRSDLGIEDMQVLAYMPTWRGLLNKKENKKQISELYNYFYELDTLLRDDQIIYVKLHPFVKSGLKYEEFNHIAPFPEEYETYDFLNATDGLITDYSSIMFDYAVSKKKILLFTYDRQEYLNDRGMYLDLNQVEFPICDTVAELAKAINEESSYPEFFAEYCKYDSESTAEDVCEYFIFGGTPKFSLEPTKKDEKKNVLILVSGIRNNEVTQHLIERLNAIDVSKYNIYITMKANSARKGTEMLSKLRKELGYIPFVFDVNYTIRDRLACLKTFKFGYSSKKTEKLINELGKREKDKYFGNAKFDTIINFSSPDKILFHMCNAFEGTKVYNFKSFDSENYKSSKKYRKYANYIAKRLSYYDYVLGTEDLMKLSCKAIDEKKVKVLLDDSPKLDFKKLLEEVTK